VVRLDSAKRYFSPKMNDRERAIFETGIALSAILHLLHGMPIPRSRSAVRRLERTMEEVIETQPFRRRVRVKIYPQVRGGVYGYDVARGENIYASVEVRYGSSSVVGELRWIRRLGYPLMYIKDIKNHKK